MAGPESAGLPRLVRGSVVTHRRRCGKPNCRCADGEALHESTVLSYFEGGRTRLLMLPAGEGRLSRRDLWEPGAAMPPATRPGSGAPIMSTPTSPSWVHVPRPGGAGQER
jgi:hypothetical protein